MGIITIGTNVATIGTSVVETLQPFTPSTTDMICWYDSVSVVKDGSNYIEELTDKSGNGYDIVQTVQADKPLWVNNQQNGYPHIRFNGSQFLQLAFGMSYSQPITVFIVWRNTGGSAIALDGYGSNFWVYKYGLEMVFGTNTNMGYNMPAVTHSILLHTAEYNGATSNAWEGMTQKVTNGNVGSLSMNGITIGSQRNGNNALTGDVCEVILYDKLLGETERTLVMNYLVTKYAL